MAITSTAYTYKVEMTPLLSTNTYGSTYDVSDYVEIDGISNITKSIDSSDYDFGVYTYADLRLKAYNKNGYFNDQNDSRSIFPFGRDKTKVTVSFIQYEITRDDNNQITNTNTIATIKFRGLINDEATRLNPITNLAEIFILSQDSVIRKTKVPAGVVTSGSLAKTAIFNILSQTAITSILTVTIGNINPDYNFTVDDGSFFDNKPTRDALNFLLLASNSVMIINDSNEIIVKDRSENYTSAILSLYGQFDIHGRENIIDLTNYNTGLHRMFTSVKVNEEEESDTGLITDYGARQKELQLEFITNNVTEATIAATLLTEFKTPKIELQVKVATSLAMDYEMLDLVSINYPLKYVPIEGTFMPILGVTILGSSTEPMPNTYGSIEINPNTAFKIIEINENPKTFETTLKLRQIGVSLSDGVFTETSIPILGFAVLGVAVLQEDTDPNDTWNPSILGGAMLGATEVVS